MDDYDRRIRAIEDEQSRAMIHAQIARSTVWMAFPISAICDVMILMDGKPSGAAIRHMIRVLEVCAEGYERSEARVGTPSALDSREVDDASSTPNTSGNS